MSAATPAPRSFDVDAVAAEVCRLHAAGAFARPDDLKVAIAAELLRALEAGAREAQEARAVHPDLREALARVLLDKSPTNQPGWWTLHVSAPDLDHAESALRAAGEPNRHEDAVRRAYLQLAEFEIHAAKTGLMGNDRFHPRCRFESHARRALDALRDRLAVSEERA